MMAKTSVFDEKLKAAFLAIGLEAVEPSSGTAGTCLGHFMLPTLAGNTLGGVGLVALVNHMQVMSGRG